MSFNPCTNRESKATKSEEAERWVHENSLWDKTCSTNAVELRASNGPDESMFWPKCQHAILVLDEHFHDYLFWRCFVLSLSTQSGFFSALLMHTVQYMSQTWVSGLVSVCFVGACCHFVFWLSFPTPLSFQEPGNASGVVIGICVLKSAAGKNVQAGHYALQSKKPRPFL